MTKRPPPPVLPPKKTNSVDRGGGADDSLHCAKKERGKTTIPKLTGNFGAWRSIPIPTTVRQTDLIWHLPSLVPHFA